MPHFGFVFYLLCADFERSAYRIEFHTARSLSLRLDMLWYGMVCVFVSAGKRMSMYCTCCIYGLYLNWLYEITDANKYTNEQAIYEKSSVYMADQWHLMKCIITCSMNWGLEFFQNNYGINLFLLYCVVIHEITMTVILNVATIDKCGLFMDVIDLLRTLIFRGKAEESVHIPC